jgi:HAD superfamily hydrolase (TIGR01490 family)
MSSRGSPRRRDRGFRRPVPGQRRAQATSIHLPDRVHAVVDEHDRDLLDVGLEQLRFVEDGALLERDVGEVDEHRLDDGVGILAEVAVGFADEGEAGHPILAFFDVDNTLMRGTSLFQLGREAWKQHVIRFRDVALFAWHQRRFIQVGENDEHLATARERALGLVGGHTQAEILGLAESIWEGRIKPRLYPETVDLTREHLAKGHEVWLVSATPWEIGDLIARRLGLTGALGTRVVVVDGVYTGELIGHVLHNERKAEAVRQLATDAGAELADSWAYSDSRNDIPLLEMVGHPVVVNPDVILAHHAQTQGWPVLRLSPASIREAQRRVRHDARTVKKYVKRHES